MLKGLLHYIPVDISPDAYLDASILYSFIIIKMVGYSITEGDQVVKCFCLIIEIRYSAISIVQQSVNIALLFTNILSAV